MKTKNDKYRFFTNSSQSPYHISLYEPYNRVCVIFISLRPYSNLNKIAK